MRYVNLALSCLTYNIQPLYLVQRLLSKPDETGQPCIFHALESRTRNSLTCLLNHVKGTKCVVAKNGETVLHVATRMGNVGKAGSRDVTVDFEYIFVKRFESTWAAERFEKCVRGGGGAKEGVGTGLLFPV